MTDTTTATAPSAAEGAADAALRAEIQNFDIISDTNSFGWEEKDNNGKTQSYGWDATVNDSTAAILANPPLSTFSPTDREAILARAKEFGGGEKAEQRAIAEMMTKRAVNARLMAGPGPGANPYQIEVFQLARDKYEIELQMDKVEAELQAISSHRTEYDPVTGKPKAVPVFKLEGEQRRQWEAKLLRLGEHLAALTGTEGESRLQRALDAAVAERKAAADRIDMRREAGARADAMVREEEVERMAKALAAKKRVQV